MDLPTITHFTRVLLLLETDPCDTPGVCHKDATCEVVDSFPNCTCISPLRGDGHVCEREWGFWGLISTVIIF